MATVLQGNSEWTRTVARPAMHPAPSHPAQIALGTPKSMVQAAGSPAKLFSGLSEDLSDLVYHIPGPTHTGGRGGQALLGSVLHSCSFLEASKICAWLVIHQDSEPTSTMKTFNLGQGSLQRPQYVSGLKQTPDSLPGFTSNNLNIMQVFPKIHCMMQNPWDHCPSFLAGMHC